eukprot:1953124-Rhodomonas_salina.1
MRKKMWWWRRKRRKRMEGDREEKGGQERGEDRRRATQEETGKEKVSAEPQRSTASAPHSAEAGLSAHRCTPLHTAAPLRCTPLHTAAHRCTPLHTAGSRTWLKGTQAAPCSLRRRRGSDSRSAGYPSPLTHAPFGTLSTDHVPARPPTSPLKQQPVVTPKEKR